jgi:hypothetical protein
MASPVIDLVEAVLPLILSLGGIFASTGAVVDFWKWLRQNKGATVEDDSVDLPTVHNRWMTHDRKWPAGKESQAEAATGEIQGGEAYTELREYAPRRPRRPPRRRAPFLAAVLVAIVFAISLAVIWILTHMGGPVEATVNATIEKAGGSILIVGSGLFAAFFAISLIGFIAIHVFTDKFDE